MATFSTDPLNPKKIENSLCDDRAIIDLHAQLIADIGQLQDPKITTANCSQLRKNWNNCFPKLAQDTYIKDKANSLVPALDGIIAMHNLKTLERFLVTNLKAPFPDTIEAVITTFVIDLGSPNPPLSPLPENASETDKRNAEAEKKIAADHFFNIDFTRDGFLCTGIISQSQGHYVSYAYDFLRKEWLYVNLGLTANIWDWLPKLPLRVNYTGDPEKGPTSLPSGTFDTDGYHPAFYIFMRESEIISVLTDSTGVATTAIDVESYRKSIENIDGALFPAAAGRAADSQFAVAPQFQPSNRNAGVWKEYLGPRANLTDAKLVTIVGKTDLVARQLAAVYVVANDRTNLKKLRKAGAFAQLLQMGFLPASAPASPVASPRTPDGYPFEEIVQTASSASLPPAIAALQTQTGKVAKLRFTAAVAALSTNEPKTKRKARSFSSLTL